MTSAVITALAQLVADEQRDDETLVDTLKRIKQERDKYKTFIEEMVDECEKCPLHP